MSVQDPYVTFSFGPSWTKKTKTLQGGGSEGHWPDLNMSCDVSLEELLGECLNVSVYDENTTSSDTLIGTASFSLRSLAALKVFGTTLDIPLSLLSSLKDKQKTVGRLILTCGLYDKVAVKIMEVDPTFVSGVLNVTKIVGRDIQTGGGLLSMNITELSTYVILKVPSPSPSPSQLLEAKTIDAKEKEGSKGKEESDLNLKKLEINQWNGRTDMKKGHNPVWDYLDLRPSVTAGTLKSDNLILELWTKTLGGIGSDKLLGTGSVSILAAGVSVGKETVLEVTLHPTQTQQIKNTQGKEKEKEKEKEMGVVPVCVMSVYVKVINQKDIITPITAPAMSISLPGQLKEKDQVPSDNINDVEEEDFIQPGFVKGMLFISSAQGIKLPNKEFIGKGDPFVLFQMGSWDARTKTLQNAGGDTVWHELEISTKVTAESLRKDYLTVTVYDENSMRDNQLICSGRVQLKRPANKIGKEMEVSIPLSDKNGRSAGRIVITAVVSLSLSLLYPIISDLIHSFIHSSYSLIIRSFTYLFIYLIQHKFIHLFIYISSFIRLFICYFFIYLFLTSSIN